MTRIILGVLGLIGLVLLLAPWVTISSDTEALTVGDNAGLPSLTDGTGLDVLVALSHPQVTQRNRAAKAIAHHLRQDPLVDEVLFTTPAPRKNLTAGSGKTGSSWLRQHSRIWRARAWFGGS